MPNILDSIPSSYQGWQGQMILVVRVALVMQLAVALPLRFNVVRSILNRWCESTESVGHVSITVAMVSSAVALAACQLKLNVAIGVTSAVCASFIIYIFPAGLDIVMWLKRNPGKRMDSRRVFAIFVVGFGFLLLLTGTYANLRGT